MCSPCPTTTTKLSPHTHTHTQWPLHPPSKLTFTGLRPRQNLSLYLPPPKGTIRMEKMSRQRNINSLNPVLVKPPNRLERMQWFKYDWLTPKIPYTKRIQSQIQQMLPYTKVILLSACVKSTSREGASASVSVANSNSLLNPVPDYDKLNKLKLRASQYMGPERHIVTCVFVRH